MTAQIGWLSAIADIGASSSISWRCFTSESCSSALSFTVLSSSLVSRFWAGERSCLLGWEGHLPCVVDLAQCGVRWGGDNGSRAFVCRAEASVIVGERRRRAQLGTYWTNVFT